MISMQQVARWSFLFFVLTLLVRIGLAMGESESSPTLSLVNTLFFWGIFAPLLYDWSRSRDGKEDRALFLLELADLIRLSLPVDEVLAKLAEVRRTSYGHRFADFSSAVSQLSGKVSAGSTLSAAFGEVPGIPAHWSVYTRFSASSDELASMLEELAHAERSSLRLPFFSVIRVQLLVPLYLTIIIFLTTYIIPTFITLFEGMNLALPLATRLLLAVTRVLSTLHFGALLSLVCLLILLAIPFESLRRKLLRVLYYLPVVGGLVKLDSQHQAYRLMGAGLKHGVPQSEAVRSAAVSMNIPAYARGLQAAENAAVLSQALAAYPGLFEETFRWLIAQGETLENLPDALLTASEVASVELDRRSRRLATSLDTYVLVAIGVFVGFAVLAVFLPMYQLIGNLG